MWFLLPLLFANQGLTAERLDVYDWVAARCFLVGDMHLLNSGKNNAVVLYDPIANTVIAELNLSESGYGFLKHPYVLGVYEGSVYAMADEKYFLVLDHAMDVVEEPQKISAGAFSFDLSAGMLLGENHYWFSGGFDAKYSLHHLIKENREWRKLESLIENPGHFEVFAGYYASNRLVHGKAILSDDHYLLTVYMPFKGPAFNLPDIEVDLQGDLSDFKIQDAPPLILRGIFESAAVLNDGFLVSINTANLSEYTRVVSKSYLYIHGLDGAFKKRRFIDDDVLIPVVNGPGAYISI